jgi:hypothetical protein
MTELLPPPESKIDRLLELSVVNAHEAGSVRFIGSLLAGVGTGLAAENINEAVHEPEALNCSAKIPIATETLHASQMECTVDTPYTGTSILGGVVLGAAAVFVGWGYIAKRRLGEERFRHVTSVPFPESYEKLGVLKGRNRAN